MIVMLNQVELSWQSLLPSMHRFCNAQEVQNNHSEVKLYIDKCTCNLILVSGERGKNALLKKAKSTFFIILENFHANQQHTKCLENCKE